MKCLAVDHGTVIHVKESFAFGFSMQMPLLFLIVGQGLLAVLKMTCTWGSWAFPEKLILELFLLREIYRKVLVN